VITLAWVSVQSLTGSASLGFEEALGMGAPSKAEEEKRSVLRDAKRQGDTFNTDVEKLLDTQQKSEWREIRKETREKFKERAEENRESQ